MRRRSVSTRRGCSRLATTSDPPALSGFGGPQIDEWPYAPRFSTSGGNRSNLAGYMTANGNLPLPRLNMSARATWADDLSMTKGRHNIKMGVSLEFNHKTEPGSADYVGNYNFGNDTNNPLNTGNGYANMLLGAFSTYTELTARVDKAVRHWQNDIYIQDNWRATPRLTLDYGVRLQHSGSDYEVNNNHTGFFTDQWSGEPGRARVHAGLHTLVFAGNQACPAGESADDRSGESRHVLPGGVQRQHRPWLRQSNQWRVNRRHLRREAGHLFQVPVPGCGASSREWRGTSPETGRPRSARRGGFSTTSRDRRARAATASPAVARSRAAIRFGGRRSTTSRPLPADRAPCSSCSRPST